MSTIFYCLLSRICGWFPVPAAPNGRISNGDSRFWPWASFRRRNLEAIGFRNPVYYTQPPELWDLWKTRFSKGWEPARQSPQLELFLADVPTGRESAHFSPTHSAEDPLIEGSYMPRRLWMTSDRSESRVVADSRTSFDVPW